MGKQAQYNILAALFGCLGAALLLAGNPEAQGMAFLAAACAFTGRGKAG